MFSMDSTKNQDEAIAVPDGLAEGIIVSPDTRRPNRIPSGQSRTKKWPVLDASGAPDIDTQRWKFALEGLVNQPLALDWESFLALPRVKVFSDFHCVTRWSRLGNLWEGVATRELMERCGGVKPEAKFVSIFGYDHGWTTNLPLADFLADDALVAISHDGEPLSIEHGGPARLIIPRLYAWKSAKWVAGVEFRDRDKAGFWERNGYHMRGDPWKEERFGT